jgi:hypothetical protein
MNRDIFILKLFTGGVSNLASHFYQNPFFISRIKNELFKSYVILFDIY